jgi:hypothetical protein
MNSGKGLQQRRYKGYLELTYFTRGSNSNKSLRLVLRNAGNTNCRKYLLPRSLLSMSRHGFIKREQGLKEGL